MLFSKLKLSTGFFKETLFAQILLVVIFVFSLVFFKWSSNFLNNSNSGLATLILNIERNERIFEGEVIEDMTVLDAVTASAKAGNVDLVFDLTENGDPTIVKLDNYSRDKNEFAVYLNYKKINLMDLNRIYIHPGDKITVDIK
jgi:hypothetical protein